MEHLSFEMGEAWPIWKMEKGKWKMALETIFPFPFSIFHLEYEKPPR
jgi:hypothetical protein